MQIVRERCKNGGRRVQRYYKGGSGVNLKRRMERKDIIGVEEWRCRIHCGTGGQSGCVLKSWNVVGLC